MITLRMLRKSDLPRGSEVAILGADQKERGLCSDETDVLYKRQRNKYLRKDF